MGNELWEMTQHNKERKGFQMPVGSAGREETTGEETGDQWQSS